MRTLRPRQAWGLGVLVACGGLLALVAVAADGSPLRAPLDDGGGGQRLLALLNVLGLAAGVLAVVVLIAILSGERNRRPQFGTRRRNLLRNLLVLAALVAISMTILPLRREAKRPQKDGQRPAGSSATDQLLDDKNGPPWPVIVLGTTVVVALAGAAWSARRRRPRPDTDGGEDELAEQRAVAGSMFDASIAELEAEPDPRRAIIAAYARLLDGLAGCGLGRRDAEAPEEHLRRALETLRVRDEPMRALVALFAEARFSEHDLTATHKAAAIDAFRAARHDLSPFVVPV